MKHEELPIKYAKVKDIPTGECFHLKEDTTDSAAFYMRVELSLEEQVKSKIMIHNLYDGSGEYVDENFEVVYMPNAKIVF